MEAHWSRNSRAKAQLFTGFLYAAAALFVLSVCWLFLSNVPLTSPRVIGRLLTDVAFWRSVKLSLVTAAITTAVALVIGVPAAYALSRFRFPGAAALDVLTMTPIVLPASTIGLMLLIAFQYSPVLALQDKIGVRLAYSQPGIIIAQLVLSLSLGIRAWKAAFDTVNPRYEHVARSLGSSRTRTFWTVTLPAARPGILAGTVLAWTRAVAEFGAVLIFCSAIRGKTDILPVAMFLDVNGGYNERAIAIGFAMTVLSLLSVWALSRIGGKRYFW